MTRVSGIRPAQTTSTSCSNASGPPSCAFAGRSAICRRRGDGVGPGVGERAGRPRAAVDLVDLDRAPLRLKGRIVQEGQLLSSADKPARVAFEVRTRSEYFDFRPPWTRIDAVPATGRRGRPRWLISTGCTNGSRRSARARGGVADAALQVQHDPTAVVLGRGTSCPSSRSSDLGPSRGGQGRGWTGRPPEGSHDGVRQLRMLRCHLGLEGARRRHRSRGGARCVPRRRLRPAHRWP